MSSLILWGILILLGLIGGYVESRKNSGSNKDRSPVRSLSDTVSAGLVGLFPEIIRQTQPIKEKADADAFPKRHAEAKRSEPRATVASTLPVEGERVTTDENPMSAESAKSTTDSPLSTGLGSKDALRRAIILGEILAPKF